MSPRQGTSRLRRLVVAVAVCALVGAWAPAASADESAMPTTQARAYNADWVPYLDPPEKPAAVCLVDSGVNITPDTPADSPDGPIVKRLALDGGPGTAAGSSWEAMHGTRMAMVAGAPINDWGAVGFWPGVRIVSIRAMLGDQRSFPFDYYSKAVDLCNKRATSERVVAVNLALSCNCSPGPDQAARLENQITAAHANDQSVVAAAGNSGGVVTSPASEPGVLAVAAADNRSTLCLFSNRGSRVDLIAPGCELDLADPTSGQLWSGYQSGTSGASMTASVVLALVRSYRPDLTWQSAEHLLTATARRGSEGPVLDVEALLRAAGLGESVDAAKARIPVPVASDPEPSAPLQNDSQTGGTVRTDFGGISVGRVKRTLDRLRAPRLKAITKRRGRLTVSVLDLPVRGRLSLTLEARESEFGYEAVARTVRSAARATLRLPRRWRGGRLVIRYELSGPPLGRTRPLYRRISR